MFLHKIRFHFKHSINQSDFKQCWIRWWRMFRWQCQTLNFLSTNFFEAIFAMDFEVSQDLFKNKLNPLWNDLTVKEFVLLHSCHNFCSTFFLWKCWKMMISFDGFPIRTNTVRFWCKVWKFFELSDYCKNWFTSPPTVFAQWIVSLISKST